MPADPGEAQITSRANLGGPAMTPDQAGRLDATIIVCTYNRAESLTRTLGCLAKQEGAAATRWEVVVVDNNSSDRTRDVVEDMQRGWPILRYEFEPQQGLSHARNRGIRAARGDALLFTDDDVCPEPDWLQRILHGMAEHRCDACGGFIAPDWEVAPPAWLTERFHGFLAVRTDRTDTYRVTTLADAPFGANMAFRRTIFESFGGFDVTRGRKGNVLSSGEDGELFERLLARGAKVMFFGNARVHHRVEGFRVTKRYLRRWRFQTSRNIAQSRGMPGRRQILGIPLYLFPQLLRACGAALKARFVAPPDEAFHRELIVCHFFGAMRGLMRSGARTALDRTAASHESEPR